MQVHRSLQETARIDFDGIEASRPFCISSRWDTSGLKTGRHRSAELCRFCFPDEAFLIRGCPGCKTRSWPRHGACNRDCQSRRPIETHRVRVLWIFSWMNLNNLSKRQHQASLAAVFDAALENFVKLHTCNYVIDLIISRDWLWESEIDAKEDSDPFSVAIKSERLLVHCKRGCTRTRPNVSDNDAVREMSMLWEKDGKSERKRA